MKVPTHRAIALACGLTLGGALAIAAPVQAAEAAVARLDGPWQALAAEGQPVALYMPGARGPWQTVSLPSRWHLHGWNVHGAVWYRKTFEVSRSAASDRAWLEIDGADYFTDAWLDGRPIGFHEGGSAPFAFPLGRLTAGTHTLVLRIDSPYEPFGEAWSLHKRLLRGVGNHHDARPGTAWDPRGQEANSGGVWGSVKIRMTGPVAMTGMTATPAVMAGDRPSATLSLALTLDGAPREATVVAELTPANFRGRSQIWTRPLRLAGDRRTARVELPVTSPRLWNTWDRGTPNLYRLKVSLRQRGRVSDVREATIGLRTVSRLPDGSWSLNGRRIFLRGTNYISSVWPGEGGARRLEGDVRLMRAANVNAVRVHAHVEPKAFYDACDRSGLLVWQDLPLQWGYADTPAVHTAAEALAREVVAGYGNHPSIFAWCAHNESPWDADWMRYKYPDYNPRQNRRLDERIQRALKAADPSRHAHLNSSTAEHPWLGWYSGSWRDYGKPTKETLISEYGAQALPVRSTIERFIPAWALWPTTDAAWALWGYHNFQRKEAFELAGVQQGRNLDQWIENTQAYQAKLTAYAATRYRLQKYRPVGGVFQFQFVDPWASAGWGAVDYRRVPKAGYRALAEAYQLVLPGVEADVVQPAGRPLSLPVRVVNDHPHGFSARLRWTLSTSRRVVAHGRQDLALPADGVAAPPELSLAPLAPGTYTLDLTVDSVAGLVEQPLGRGRYTFTCEERL